MVRPLKSIAGIAIFFVALQCVWLIGTVCHDMIQFFGSLFPNFTPVPGFVPHNEFMNTLMREKTARWTLLRMKLSILGAYDYGTHIVVTTGSDGWYGRRVYCRYLSSNKTELGYATAGTTFPEYSVNCSPSKLPFSRISLTEHVYSPIEESVQVQARNEDTMKYELSMCLSPTFGNDSNWLLITEMVEHYKLQGVEHFYFYINGMDEYSRKLVTSYELTGEVEVKELFQNEHRSDYDWQLIGIMDCLHKTRFESKYVLFGDMDERITPSNSINLLEYSKRTFEEDETVGMLMFRPRWILMNRPQPSEYKGIKTLLSHLPTLVFHNTSHWPSIRHTSKFIVDPKKVLSLWIHFSEALFPGYNSFYVPPNEVIIRHYRNIVGNDWETKWLPKTLKFGKMEYSSYPQALQKKLFANVKKRLDDVYGIYH